jgi:hypothetical protein
MGRPISKRYFGPLSGTTGTPSGDGYDQAGHNLSNTSNYTEKKRGFNIPVEQARVTGGDLDIGGDAAATPYIIAQKGSRKYRVMTSSGAGNCVLVDDDGSSEVTAGEMVIKGYVGGDAGVAGSGVAIKKLTKFYATDFSGNRYKWYVANDGSSLQNVLVLVTGTDTSVN